LESYNAVILVIEHFYGKYTGDIGLGVEAVNHPD
jgi:hypothetical protein